jgi:Cu(I)/Ag(I) efflux system periplasmic protein CusF
VIAVPSAAATPLARAEVLNVYPKERRVLLRHDAIPSLGMSAMTMEFGLAEPGMLKGLRKGSRIRFMAIREADDYLITRIEVPK